MEIIRTFKRPENFSSERWRLTLNAWMAISLVGAVVGGVCVAIVAFVFWSSPPGYVHRFGMWGAIEAAALPLAALPIWAPWPWMFLSSLRTSRRFAPTGRRATVGT